MFSIQVGSRASIFSCHMTLALYRITKMQERMAGCWSIEETRVLISVWSDESILTMLDSVAEISLCMKL